MSYEIIKINENSWRIEDGAVRFFLLTGTEKALLIDSGMNVLNAKEIAEEITSLPLSLLNTHSDRDHVASNGEFGSFYMSPDEESTYRRNGGTGEVIPVREGDVIDLGGRVLRIIDIPGHTPGSIAILDVNARVLISGDSIQDGSIFMFGDHRNMPAYVKSLEHLRDYTGEFDEIWPSHATLPVKPELIESLHDGASAILDGTAEGEKIDFRGNIITKYDMGFASFLCD